MEELVGGGWRASATRATIETVKWARVKEDTERRERLMTLNKWKTMKGVRGEDVL